MKFCRFCQKKTLRLLFPANKTEKSKTPDYFVCTNCGFGSHGPIVECQSCGIIYVDETISQNQISTYYEVAKDPLYFAEQPARKKTFEGYLERLERVFPTKGKLLDIGTNTGPFVKLAKDHGWDAIGLEPNHWAVKYAKENYNVDIVNKPFEKNSFPRESFEVVTMWDVIEHFTNPILELEKVYRQLKTGGIFAFSTVDPKSPLAKIFGSKWSWYMDMHRVFFTQKTAKHYLEKVGFKKVVFKPHWRHLSLGYLSTRLLAVNANLAKWSTKTIALLAASKTIVPYYANDLFDCYALK